MRILLIGHKGYVGAGLHRFLRTGHEVIGWGREQDICTLDSAAIRDLEVRAVINCAAIIEKKAANFVAGSESDRVNVGGARALVAALKDTDIPLIQISTKDVFGNVYVSEDVTEEEFGYRPKILIDDSQPFAPATLYAKTKLMSELIVESYPKSVVIRIASCYTDFDHSRGSWVVSIIKSIQQGKTVAVTNTGKQFRDPLHVNDLGRLIEMILASDRFGIKMNAGGGMDNLISILEYIRLISHGAKVTATAGDDYGFAFNNRLAKEVFGWKPRISLVGRLPTILKNITEKRTADS